MSFLPWNRRRDPKIVTMLPAANLRSEQERLDDAIELDWRFRVAENIRTKGPDRRRKADDLRQKYAEAQRLRYFRQAS